MLCDLHLWKVVIRRGLKPPHQHGPNFSHHNVEGDSLSTRTSLEIVLTMLTLLCRIEWRANY